MNKPARMTFMEATPAILRQRVREDALAHAREYVDFCVRHGFHPGLDVATLLDPDAEESPSLSPFFDPSFYCQKAGLDPSAGVNPYLHYFQTGWRSDPGLSRLVDRLELRRRGWSKPESVPMLNAIARRAENDDGFSCNALFDPAFYRRHAPRARTGALVEFLAQRVGSPFSPFVDLGMLDRATAALNARGRNALVCLLEAPVGAEANPMFFSGWYAERYRRGRLGERADRDMLSDYLLIGVEKGFLPNPFAARDFGLQSLGPTGPSKEMLLDYLKVSHFAEGPDR